MNSNFQLTGIVKIVFLEGKKVLKIKTLNAKRWLNHEFTQKKG
jgi:hypothetical protein